MIECSQCEKINHDGSLEMLPNGWNSKDGKYGIVIICPDCAPKEAERNVAKTIWVGEYGELIAPQALTETTKDKLRAYVARLEQIEAEAAEISDQKVDVYADAKALGFDTKALRAVIAIRKKDPKKRGEEEMMVDLYLHALGEIL